MAMRPAYVRAKSRLPDGVVMTTFEARETLAAKRNLKSDERARRAHALTHRG